MSGYIAISGLLSNIPQGTINVGPLVITATTQNYMSATNVVLASGVNTIAVPTFAVGCIVQPPPTNAVALTFKGVSGDTGMTISPTLPFIFCFPTSTPASFVIVAASLTTGDTTVTFF
jgi:hypothetical protein